jgi:hypothetical protein
MSGIAEKEEWLLQREALLDPNEFKDLFGCLPPLQQEEQDEWERERDYILWREETIQAEEMNYNSQHNKKPHRGYWRIVSMNEGCTRIEKLKWSRHN